MGVSWDDIQSGVLDTGKLVAETMALWNQVTGKTPAAAATTVPAATPAVTPTSQTSTSTAATTAFPTWAIVALGLGAFVLLMRG